MHREALRGCLSGEHLYDESCNALAAAGEVRDVHMLGSLVHMFSCQLASVVEAM